MLFLPPEKILLTLKTALGNRKLANEIGEKYLLFGRHILCDEAGTVTKEIAANSSNAVDINNRIFSEWLQGRGRQPVTWSTLINALNSIEMQDLANYIEQNLKIKV